MIKQYLELRSGAGSNATKLMADLMRHFHARQNLGTAVVLAPNPQDLLSLARRQWSKLSRELQKRRSLAVSSVEVLNLTHGIAQMQQAVLSCDPPHERPDASIYFVRPDMVMLLPSDCFTAYLTQPVSHDALAPLIAQFPASALVVDYAGQDLSELQLAPKGQLERNLASSWRHVTEYLENHGVDVARLGQDSLHAAFIDDAVDALLDEAPDFLSVLSAFHRSLDLARPLKSISKTQRDQYETVLMLARYMQTLAPMAFSTKFITTEADDTFFLNDNISTTELLREAVQRHEEAGRLRLARALMRHGVRGTLHTPRTVAMVS